MKIIYLLIFSLNTLDVLAMEKTKQQKPTYEELKTLYDIMHGQQKSSAENKNRDQQNIYQLQEGNPYLSDSGSELGSDGKSESDSKSLDEYESKSNGILNITFDEANDAILVGKKYFYGQGVKADCDQAFKKFMIAAKQSINEEARALGLYYLGKCYFYEYNNYVLARKFFKKAVKQNVNKWVQVSACYFLGQMNYFGSLEYGHGIKKDYSKAKGYLKKAFNQEVNESAKKEAACFLGLIYYYGKNVKENSDKAEKYFKVGISQSDNKWAQLQSLYNLGFICYYNLDYKKSAKYLELVVSDTFEDAQNQKINSWEILANIYYKHLKDYVKAIYYFEIILDYEKHSSIYKRSDAALHLGEIYYHGYGVNQDHVKASSYFKKAIKVRGGYCYQAKDYLKQIDVQKH